MYRGELEQEHAVRDRVFAELGFSPSRPATLEGIQASHMKLSADTPNRLRQFHYLGAHYLIKDALSVYADKTSDPGLTKLEILPAKVELGGVVNNVAALSFPTDELASMSFRYINKALDFRRNVPGLLREAEVNIALAAGKNIPTLRDAKFDYVEAYHRELVELNKSHTGEDTSIESERLAVSILRSLGLSDIETIRTTPLIEDLAVYAKDHGRSIGMTVAAATISASLFASPSLANASTIPSSSNSSSQVTTAPEMGLTVGTPDGTTSPDTASTATTSETGPQVLTAPTLSLGIGTPNEQTSSESQLSSAPIATAPTIPVSEVAPTVSAPTAPTDTPAVSTVTIESPSVPTTTPVSSESVSVATPSSPEADTSDTQTVTAPVTPEVAPATTPSPEQVALTPNQQAITSIIEQGGDSSIASASFLLRQYYGTQTQSGSTTPTNADFLTNLDTQEATYLNAVSDPDFHEDATYKNTAAMALAVLDAAANDQTVLSNSEVTQLIANVTRPTDPDKASLFDQYLAQAKTLMAANNGDYLTGFSSQYQTLLQTMYAYILMANVSDADQATQIQQIKNAEAAAAAAKAEHQAVSGSVEGQTIQKMIDGETGDTVNKRMYEAMQFFMNNGYTPTQSAGIVGNLMAESASSMDPSKPQDGGGPGRGLAQWEGPRLVNLKAFAATKGTTWDDFDTQLEFILNELSTNRNDTVAPLQAATTLYGAASAFMIYYETPAVVLTKDQTKINNEAAIRANYAQPMLDTFDKEVTAINQQNEAAAAAVTKATQQKLANVATLTSFTGKWVSNIRNSYWPGNCTYWVDIVRAKAGDPIPEGMGDAGNWAIDAAKDNYAVSTTPTVGSVFVIPFSKEHPYGHVGYVTDVDTKAKTFTESEMNVDGLSIVDQRTFAYSTTAGYLFIGDKITPPAPTPAPAISLLPSINLNLGSIKLNIG